MNARLIIIENIKVAMAAKGLDSESALARHSHCNQKTINNLMNPEMFQGSPKLETIEKIATSLGKTVSQLTRPVSLEIADTDNAPPYGFSSELIDLALRINALPTPLRDLVTTSLEQAEKILDACPTVGNSATQKRYQAQQRTDDEKFKALEDNLRQQILANIKQQQTAPTKKKKTA